MKLTDKQLELFVMMYEGGGTISQISRVLGFPAEQFTEVRKANNIPIRVQNQSKQGKIDAPPQLLEDAKTMTLAELKLIYPYSDTLLRRILNENNIPIIHGELKRKALGLSRVEPIVKKPEIVQSVYDRAADHLRRFYANVHRCDIQMFDHQRVTWGDLNNVPNHGDGYYYVDGKGVLPHDRMLSLARERGFAEEAGNGY